jgi:adenine-specific DNA-methyltransferase
LSTLSSLLRQVEQEDPALAEDIRDHIQALAARREFGLNFERHTPETVELPGRPIRKGDKVRFLVPRGEDPTSVDQRLWRVMSISRTDDGRVASLARRVSQGHDEVETRTRACEDLIVVAEFRDPIYPGLVSAGKIERGGDRPFHTLINAENFHALQTLLYTHGGRVDAIYIDPPYNTGARDWKYNNDYVDSDDIYRHSKWLAFMERRLKLARRLLNPADSVLIVTIDEHEVHRLRMLLEQTFPEAYVQMVTIVVNPKGVAQGRFARVEEYALYCFFGSAGVQATQDDLLSDSATLRNTRFWKGLLRAGTNANPTDGLGMVYPIFVDPERAAIVSLGRTLRERIEAGEVDGDPNTWLPSEREGAETPNGLVAVWPLRRDGSLGVWQAIPETLRSLHGQRMVKAVLRPEGWAISYVPNGVRSKIDSGEVAVAGYDEQSGAAMLAMQRDLTRAKTVWKRARHDAGWHGSVVLRKLLNARVFDFPKSLYATRDALEPVVTHKKDALIVDFFTGSGTTAHAVALLNRADGGRRRSISVTNNEVGPDAQTSLRAAGLRPGDDAWESEGIFRKVTVPRITAAVTGLRPDGAPVDLEYEDGTSGSEGFDENVEFFTMTYEAPRPVAHHKSFEAIAPLLWLRAGAEGARIEKAADDFAVADTYGVLFDLDASHAFLDTIAAAERLGIAFIVTDDDRAFQMVCSELPPHVEPVRLYESYLTNFTINTGRE